ncbi:pumilio family RNA-binding protein [Entamoeba histolytica HM-1:IMSS-B]|uniref:Pumilio family RNA-binding protein n=6 Tax=Entamoeba histolytica TaxID=5759 RepID=C4LZ96_ENTH1|nr:pumilio family RNA-binding protein [Entamoeba histolytica HM-1:IMSS]EMD43022.1 pumilio domain containing protein [Entamoeba histolytica KU27]EMH76020.1 pumilio family RNA-binding protein [Entamoeba histolytica HM-1:IMSS-B]EMS15242.1 pumilio domain containing protein C6G9.14 [Entamoeba histolytica HM-3:IMSS]ENY65187.1 pumilio domain containing protein [Entamoeba histolytica HM-1:IMSS-A]GAT94177.1 pumilio family RNA-binding protein [Entamoeba histolytica]|eukprot:XP_652766.1 pumilio family RNA-binding protein [Entamoeba histolytica HM-1:IMSS]
MRVVTHSIISLLTDEENLSAEDVEIFSGEIKESLESFVPIPLHSYEKIKRSNSACLSSDFIIPFVKCEESMFSYLTPLCSHEITKNNNNEQILTLSSRVLDLMNTQPSFQKKLPNKNKSYSLPELCKDQQGSRKIQQFFEIATEEEIDQIFRLIYSDSIELMIDLFGNYVIQKLVEYGTKKHVHLLFEKLQGNVVKLSLHMYGCRVIQKIIEVLSPEEVRIISSEIKSNVSTFIEDQNGNHVIQKFIDFASEIDLNFMIDEIYTRAVEYSKHPYGCRVIQRLIEKNSQNCVKRVTDKLVEYVWELSINQYGNYVIQHLIQYGTNEQRVEIVNNIKGKLYEYSMKKYSSNVVEKCIRCCETREQTILVNELCNSNVTNKQINEMICDPYANYVIQRLIEMMDFNQKNYFIETFISPNIDSLRRNTHAKHLIQRIVSSTL